MNGWLDVNPPARDQWANRLGQQTGLVVLHTAESPVRLGAETVARFIQGRADAGSYHGLVEPLHGLHLIDWVHGAYHCKGYNSRSMGLAFAAYANDWPGLSAQIVEDLLTTAAVYAVEYSKWLQLRGGPAVAAKHINQPQAASGVSGFTGHGELDPGRRYDPGEHFPWEQFIDIYGRLTETGEQPMAVSGDSWVRIMQQAINERLPADARLVVDGVPGPKTAQALTGALATAAAPVDRYGGVVDAFADLVIDRMNRKA